MRASALDRRTGNLPADLTSFVGRRTELADVTRLLRRSRLVTLHGVGGVGKTRLAVRAAAGLAGEFPGGVWLVELSALNRPDLLAHTVADALRLPDHGSGDTVDLLVERLAAEPALLVLDTCEHLLDACAMLAEVLLASAPELRIVATSRQPLDAPGEHLYPVPPLADALELFLDRASAAAPGFVLTPEDRERAALLCERLDGIPLAVELAAARLRSMSPAQLLERLDDRFALLGSRRARGRRHQTLRAAVEWSHDLCTPEERRLWARLSVFPGDFDETAAVAVCADGELPAGRLPDLLAALVDKAVVVWDRDSERHRLLDTLRDFGAERLAALDERGPVRERHLRFFLALARRVTGDSLGPGQIPLLVRARVEQHNLRGALDHALSDPATVPDAVEMVNALYFPWLSLGMLGEGLEWTDRVLAASPGRNAARAWALSRASSFLSLQWRVAEAEALLDEAEEIAAEVDDPHLAAWMPFMRAVAMFYDGRVQEAVPLLREAAARHSGAGYRHADSVAVYIYLGTALLLVGDVGSALGAAEEGIAICADAGETWCGSTLLGVRGLARSLGGDPRGALPDCLESLRTKASYGDLLGIAVALEVTAFCRSVLREAETAASLLGAADALWRALRSPGLGAGYATLRGMVSAEATRGLGAERFAALYERGQGMTPAEAVECAEGSPLPGEEERPLSARELEVAGLVSQGLSNREIAERLVIAKRTVDSHLEHILSKLGFSSRTQIAVWIDRRR